MCLASIHVQFYIRMLYSKGDFANPTITRHAPRLVILGPVLSGVQGCFVLRFAKIDNSSLSKVTAKFYSYISVASGGNFMDKECVAARRL